MRSTLVLALVLYVWLGSHAALAEIATEILLGLAAMGGGGGRRLRRRLRRLLESMQPRPAPAL